MLVITPLDNVWVRVDCDDAIAQELNDYFSFDTPGAQFMRRQSRFKGWDGKVRLFKAGTRRIYRGLVPRVLEFAAQNEYPVTNHIPDVVPLWTEADMLAAIDALAPTDANGDLLTPDDYQLEALRFIIANERGIIQSPTGSGKSLILYMLVCGLLPHLKALIIVPTIGLVTQMQNDFISYGCTETIHAVSAGKAKSSKARITVSTWQSIAGQDKSYFDQYGVVVVDEVHGAKAKSLTGIMEKCETAYRVGVTGTVNNTECHRLILEGLFGSIEQVATTDELVKRKRLSKPKVIVCVLKYPDDIKKAMRRKEYADEIDFLCRYEPRNRFLALMARETKGPTLALFQHVAKHGEALFARFMAICKGRPVHYISGATSSDEREAIREAIAKGEDDILVASYGTTQLGVNIPKLRNLLLTHPSKSIIRVLQSIGRVLRLSAGKDEAVIVDIVDDLRIGKWVNHTFRHAEARMQFYTAEQFKPVLKEIDMQVFVQMTAGKATAGVPATTAPVDDQGDPEMQDGALEGL